MWQFNYEVFEFLEEFQLKRPQNRILVIQTETGLEMYSPEEGIMLATKISYDDIIQHMGDMSGRTMDKESALSSFKSLYFVNVGYPISVNKDIVGVN